MFSQTVTTHDQRATDQIRENLIPVDHAPDRWCGGAFPYRGGMTSTSVSGPILQRFPLGAQWPTVDPFLFVAHHLDRYPAGNDSLGPDASLDDRRIGMDFDGIDGWNMYHGATVPGFPQHPHRGFETITHVRRGHVDHADSLGATARFGHGDTQWMTAGGGIVHAEMFPLLDKSAPNPLELFQIWLNLPAADKLVDPYFTMLWREDTPVVAIPAPSGRGSVEVTVIAGRFVQPDAGSSGDGAVTTGPAAPPNSWASRPDADVAIWHLAITEDAEVTLPVAPGTRRSVYVFDGAAIGVGEPAPAAAIEPSTGAEVVADAPLQIRSSGDRSECLVLQGRPIGEAVAQYGPFVMNDRQGIVTAMDDYQRTGFGGWPWPSDDPVHERSATRFARHADGKVETPT